MMEYQELLHEVKSINSDIEIRLRLIDWVEKGKPFYQ